MIVCSGGVGLLFGVVFSCGWRDGRAMKRFGKGCFRGSLFFLLSGLFVSFGGLAETTEKRPNIILLFADDQRPDSVGAFGNPHVSTPNLDRLVGDGFRFSRNYCAGSYSGAVCVASRTMLMTGRHWMRVEDRRDWNGLPLLPEQLAQGGYRTFITGKWHNGSRALQRAFQQGQSVFMGGMSDHTEVPVADLTLDGKLVNQRTPKGFSSQIFADAAVRFLENTSDKEPFFLYVAFTAPHDPRNPPEAYRERYYEDRPPLPPNFMPQHPFDNGFVSGVGRDESLAPWPRSAEMVSDQLCEYYGLITHLDEQVGRIMAALAERGDVDNTYVVYTADHGLAMGSHGLLGKQNIYEHSVQSPFIIRGPGVPRGESSSALIYIHDLYATFCELGGVPVPDGVDSENLAPVWRGDQERLRSSQFLPFRDIMRGITDGRWKLHRYPEINHSLLFDLEADPHELVNLADKAQYQPHFERLWEAMEAWQQRLGDTLPLSVPRPQTMAVDYSQFEQRLDRWQPKWIRDKYFGGREPGESR